MADNDERSEFIQENESDSEEVSLISRRCTEYFSFFKINLSKKNEVLSPWAI